MNFRGQSLGFSKFFVWKSCNVFHAERDLPQKSLTLSKPDIVKLRQFSNFGCEHKIITKFRKWIDKHHSASQAIYLNFRWALIKYFMNPGLCTQKFQQYIDLIFAITIWFHIHMIFFIKSTRYMNSGLMPPISKLMGFQYFFCI